MKNLKFFAFAVLTLTAFVTGGAPIDEGQLSNAIFRNLSHYCRQVDTAKLSRWTGPMAADCSSATDFAALNTRLINTFSNVAWLEWTNNSPLLTAAAAQIALEVFPTNGAKPTLTYPYTLMQDTSSNSWGQVSLWTGAKLGNPYTINTSTKTLESANSSSDPYIEISFNERYVMRSGKYDDITFGNSEEHRTLADGRIHGVNPFFHLPDVDGSFGYIFTSGNDSTNFTVSTIVGSSDVYGNSSVGFPVLRYCSEDFSWKQQVTLEVDGGFATDKNFISVHPNIFLGAGYQGKFPNVVGSTNGLPVYWFGRVGMAMIDQPQFSGSNIVFNTTGGLAEPVFENKWDPTLGTSIIVPVTPALSLQAGANVYFSNPPASWNITLGVTMDLSKFSRGLGTVLGLQ